MSRRKYLSPCLYFSSFQQDTVKSLVLFCPRLGWTCSSWGWKIFCSAQTKGVQGWKLWQQKSLQQLFVFRLIYAKGLEDKNSLRCSLSRAERKVPLIKHISETFLEVPEKSQCHHGCEKPSVEVCEVPATTLESAAPHFRRSLLFAEL